MNTNTSAKRILCYGDSNSWGWTPGANGTERFGVNERWPGIVQKTLGEDYEVIEETLGGRMTMSDDERPEFPERNGLKTLPIILESHLPLDLVILMLGTADTKEAMDLSSGDITEGMRMLVRTVKSHKVLKGSSAPKILIVVPPIVKETSGLGSKLFKGGTAKGKELSEGYRGVAESEEVFYLDPSADIEVDDTEGVHLNAENQTKLASLICGKIKQII